MNELPEPYRERVTLPIEKARALLERGERIEPIAFLGNLENPGVDFVLLNTADGNIRADSMAQLRRAGQRIRADFVFTIMEAWGLPPEKVHRFDAIVERYGSIAASPHALDLVSFALETREGAWVAQVAVKPKGISKRKKTFAAPEFRSIQPNAGPFVSLLPPV